MKKALAVVGAAVALVALGAAGGRSGSSRLFELRSAIVPSPLLGIQVRGNRAELATLDPETLREVPGKALPLGEFTWSWSFAPDRSRIAFGGQHGIRIVDASSLSVVRDVEAAAGFGVAWLAPSRIVVFGADAAWTRIAVVDPDSGAVVARRLVAYSFEKAALAGDRVVLLLGPRLGIGVARLAVVGVDGSLRSVPLRRIRAGTENATTRRPIVRNQEPGLAVDANGGRAFVVGGSGVVASVALDTLAVSYHEPRASHSLLARGLGLVEDEAQAKTYPSGPVRTAAWLGSGTLAIWGVDRLSSLDARQRLRFVERAAGLQLVDVDTWRTRVLDRGASRMAVADGLLLTAAELSDWHGHITGIGLNSFDQEGRRAFHLFGKRPFWAITVVGSRAFAGVGPTPGYEVVDLGSGEAVESIPNRWLPRPLVESTSLSPWDSF